MVEDADTIRKLAALAQDTRLTVFKQLMRASPDGMAAGTIAELVDVAPNALSPHLAALTRAGLANVERRGRSLIYTASIDGVNSLVAALVDDCCNGHPDVCQALETSKSLAC